MKNDTKNKGLKSSYIVNIKLKLTNLNSDKIVRVKVSIYLVILKKLEVYIMLYPYVLKTSEKCCNASTIIKIIPLQAHPL